MPGHGSAAGVAAVFALLRLAVTDQTATANCSCDFGSEPVFPDYFCDPSCMSDALGCKADGRNLECRFCGGGAYVNISCPQGGASSKRNATSPSARASHASWESSAAGQMAPIATAASGEGPCMSVPCPVQDQAGDPALAACSFGSDPKTRYKWDPSCRDGMPGCLADGVHVNCRFCGGGAYVNISCAQSPPEKTCTFVNEPTARYFWDPTCALGVFGCWADRAHANCRFCGSGMYKNISCPTAATPPTRSAAAAGATSVPVATPGRAPASPSAASRGWTGGTQEFQSESAAALSARTSYAPTLAFDQGQSEPAMDGAPSRALGVVPVLLCWLGAVAGLGE